MKKNYFYGAMAAFGLLAFSSCSSDDNSLVGPNPEELTGEQVIVLDMQDTDVLSTKSRPLASTTNKGAEKVTDVKLLAFGYDETEKIYKFEKELTHIKNWNNTSSDYVFGRKKEIKLTGDDRLGGGQKSYKQYIILAVGQDESDENAIPAPFQIDVTGTDAILSKLEDNTWSADAKWNVASDPGNGFITTVPLNYGETTKPRAGEIFSGVSKPINFTIEGGFSTTVLLKRQVAGVLGYFSRIPAYVGTTEDNAQVVKSVRLVASKRNNVLDLTTKLDDQEDDATHKEEGFLRTEKVVNGTTGGEDTHNKVDAKFKGSEADDAYVIYSINLADWFEYDQTQNSWKEDAILDAKANKHEQLLGNVKGWKNAIDPTNSTIVVKDGAVLAGEFVIPFTRDDSKNTFELQLVGGDQNEVLKSWTVKLDQLSQSGKDNSLNYSIYRNHLYQVGKRGADDTIEEGGEDKPQPLDKDQELIIKINDQWEFIHDMEIE